MIINVWTKKHWINLVFHSYDGFHFWRVPEIIIRAGWITFGFGRKKKTAKECFDVDKKMKIYEQI